MYKNNVNKRHLTKGVEMTASKNKLILVLINLT